MKYELSICIITYNRGIRALENVENLLNNIKDTWCVWVLDNHSKKGKEYYKKIKKLSKSHKQLFYKKHDKNLQFYGNFRACFTYAKSKYIVVLSDEDFINTANLEKLIIDIKQSKNLGACRPSIAPYKDLKVAGNSTIYDDKLFNAGEEALFNFSFLGNYISGIVYNLKAIKKTNILEVFDRNISSHKNYPHIYLDLLVSSMFDVMTSSKATVWEREAEETLIENGTSNVAGKHIGLYGYGERINQFLALRDAICESIELSNPKNDEKRIFIFLNTYIRLVQKYFFLISKANMPFYINNRMEENLLKESFFYLVCSSVVNHPYIGAKENKDMILNKLSSIFQGYKNK